MKRFLLGGLAAVFALTAFPASTTGRGGALRPSKKLWSNVWDVRDYYTPAGGVQIRYDRYVLPVQGRVSSEFGFRIHPVKRRGHYHKGIDLVRRAGSPVLAARSGRVAFTGWRPGYGRTIEVTHPDGQSTIYGHLSAIEVKKGDFVLGGQSRLGVVGSTGMATGPHLHFEVRDASRRPIDPRLKFGRL